MVTMNKCGWRVVESDELPHALTLSPRRSCRRRRAVLTRCSTVCQTHHVVRLMLYVISRAISVTYMEIREDD